MLVSELTEQWRSAEGAGFDLSAERLLVVANRAIKRLAARARNVEAQVALGDTVADQAAYNIPTRVLDLKTILVGGTRYGRASQTDYFELVAGIGWAMWPFEGCFAPTFNDAGGLGGSTVSIYPTPTESGTELIGLALVIPDDLTLDNELPFQDDAVEALLHAMCAVGYETVDENAQMASYHDDLFREEAEQLGTRHRGRVGSGPVRLRYVGRR